MPISAGLRVGHIRAAEVGGRILCLDLSSVPEDKRPTLIARVKELMAEAVAAIAVEEQNSAGASTVGSSAQTFA